MTVGELVNKCPEAKKKLKKLFDVFYTLENILKHDKACVYYHRLMLEVIAEKEKEDGNVVYTKHFGNYPMSWTITTTFEEVKKKYGGTVLLPLL